jgi:hypothetical protein
MNDQWEIDWHDSGREPRIAPDPRFPRGVDVDVAANAVARCKTLLPYPARRCGAYTVRCRVCGFTGVVTTAGRTDDPRSFTAPCASPKDQGAHG